MGLFLQKTRKVFRKIFLMVGVSAVSLLFQACYGMPMGPDMHLPCEEDDCEICLFDGTWREPGGESGTV